MEAKDLRIGNILQEKKYKTPQRINKFFGLFTVEVDSPYFDYETDDCHTPCLGNLEPIPLTEEWLVSMNYFKILDDLFHHETQDKKIDHSVNMKDGKFYSDPLCEKEIKYVHTLQNAYRFDVLTGEELTIK